MKILLIYPKVAYMKPWIPIGVLSIASFLRKNGFEDITFFDMNSNNFDVLIPKLNDFDVIGIGGTTIQYNSIISTSKIIREHNKTAKIVFGGAHFSSKKQIEKSMDYCDVCVFGEGEMTVLDICKKKSLEDIAGIAFKRDGLIVYNEDRQFIENLDEIPFPAYDLINLKDFTDTLVDGGRCISIMTGRGCPNNCHFCASPNIWKRKVRYHSLEYTIKHIEHLIKNFNIKNLRIMDDTFTLNKKRVFEFCDLIEKLNVPLQMNFLTGVKCADLEMLKRMRDVGFSLVGFGIECGNTDLLKKISKNISIEDIKMAISNAKQAGLKTECLFMIGNIGETEQSIKDSIELSKQLQSFSSYFQFAVPYPGSRFHEDYTQYGTILNENFDEFNPRKVVFIPDGLTKEKMEYYMEIAMRRL